MCLEVNANTGMNRVSVSGDEPCWVSSTLRQTGAAFLLLGMFVYRFNSELFKAKEINCI